MRRLSLPNSQPPTSESPICEPEVEPPSLRIAETDVQEVGRYMVGTRGDAGEGDGAARA